MIPAVITKQYSVHAMLVGGDIGPLSQRQLYFANKALESNNRGLSIIEELLNVAKADAGRLVLNPTTFDIRDLVQTVATEQQPDIEAAGLSLTLNLPPEPLTVMADHDKLYMAVGNVLDNARKYTPTGGQIKIDVRHKFHEVRITVADTGVGIPAADIRHIFDRFRRSHSPGSADVGGTGLGLYLVRSVIELHRGRIKVSSRPGKGARFILCIPYNRIAAHEASRPAR